MVNDYPKSEREQKTQELMNALEACVTPEQKAKAQKALLAHIEGEKFFSVAEGVKVVLFNGPPRSGKDTAADFAMQILQNLGAKYRFAEPLKNATHAMFGYADVKVEHFNSVKDTPLEAFHNMTPRQAYIWLSEDVVKPKFGHDFWANVAVTSIKQLKKPVVVISDCGFVEEAKALIEAFGKNSVAIVQLERTGTDFSKDSRNYISVEGVPLYKITNDGTVHEFYEAIEKMLNEFTGAE
jgi:hypothetical protein